MSKFTIDLKEKKILFHEPFTKSDLEEVLSLLNIPDSETWKIDLADNYLSDTPNQIWQEPNITYPQPHWTYYRDNTGDPYQPPFTITSDGTSGTINVSANTDTTTTTTSYGTLDAIYNTTTN